jgi:hypothetical protein
VDRADAECLCAKQAAGVVNSWQLGELNNRARCARHEFVAVLLFVGLVSMETNYEFVFALLHVFEESLVYDHYLKLRWQVGEARKRR